MESLEFRYKSLIESTLDAVIIINAAGKVVEWNTNAVELFKWTKEEVFNKNLYEFIIPARFVEAHKKAMLTNAESGVVPVLNNRIEIVGLTKEGLEVAVELTITPLISDTETFYCAFIRDISKQKETEQKLEAERNLFNGIIESITEPIFYKTTSHVYLRCNQAFADLHGKSAKEIIGKSDRDLYLSDDVQKFIESDLFVINNKEAAINEEWFTSKNGDSKFLNTIKLPSYNEKGEVQGIVGICRNLTEIKEAESRQRHLNMELQKVIRNLKGNEEYLQGINRFASTILKQNTITEIVWEATENLINELGIVDCIIYLIDESKQNLVQHAAYGPKKLPKQKIKNPIIIPIGKGIVGSVAKSGKSELINDTSKDERYILDDDLRYSELSVPIIADGEIIGVIDSEHPDRNFFDSNHLEKFQTIANLVSFRLKNAINQEKLQIAQDSITKLTTAVEQSSISILMTDVNGMIEYANPAFEKLTGYTSEECLGKKTSILRSGEQSKEFYNKLWKTILSGKKWTGEIINKKKNGENYWVLSAISPIINENGVCTDFVYMQTDITQLKQLENELINEKLRAEAADKSKSIFLANMSHEIRTPLNAIYGMTKLLSDSSLNKDQERLVDGLEISSQNLLQIITDILDFSKIESGNLNLETTVFSLQELFQKLYEMLEFRTEEKKLLFDYRIDENIHNQLIGDPFRLHQVLLNLLNNAVKFTQKGSIILNAQLKRSETDYASIEFSVSDTGIGIESCKENSIFESFKQADESITREYGGSGLGLPICKELIELMGGEIKVSSKFGEGSRFYFSITLKKDNSNKPMAKEIIIDQNALGGKKILIVEDNEFNLFITKSIIDKWNVNSRIANNGLEAIQLLKNEEFDLVLMDKQMPVMGGLEASERIRKDLKLKIPIIALTANVLKGVIDDCLNAGMNDYIAKPFEPEQLYQKMCEHLSISSPQKEAITKSAINSFVDKEKKLFQLVKLNKLLGGNQKQVRIMLNKFLEVTPSYIVELEDALKSNDFEQVSRILHKLKSSVNLIANDEIIANLGELYKVSEEKMNYNLLKQKLPLLINTLGLLIKELSNELNS